MFGIGHTKVQRLYSYWKSLPYPLGRGTPLKAFDQKVCVQRRGFLFILTGDLGEMAKSGLYSLLVSSVCTSLPNLPAHPHVSPPLSSQGAFATAFMGVYGKGGDPTASI